MANKREIIAEAKKPIIIWDRKNKKRRLNKGEELVWLNGGIKLIIAKEFRYECSQMQSTLTVFNTVLGWAMFRATFGSKKIEKSVFLGKIRVELKLQLRKLKKNSRAK